MWPRNVLSHAAIAASRPDIRYHLLAIDFLPAIVLRASLQRLSAAMASGRILPLPDVAHAANAAAAALRQLSKVCTYSFMHAKQKSSQTDPSQLAIAQAVLDSADGCIDIDISACIMCFKQTISSNEESGAAPQANHVGRVTVRLDQHQPTPLPYGNPIAARSVLITGGLGALGLLVATWLARRSAQLRLVLVGRTGRGPARGAAVATPLQDIMSGAAGGSMFTLCMGDACSAADIAEACTISIGMQPPMQARPRAHVGRLLRYQLHTHDARPYLDSTGCTRNT